MLNNVVLISDKVILYLEKQHAKDQTIKTSRVIMEEMQFL